MELALHRRGPGRLNRHADWVARGSRRMLTANHSMANLIRSGLLDRDRWAFERFSLDQMNEAVADAAREAGAFKATVVRP